MSNLAPTVDVDETQGGAVDHVLAPVKTGIPESPSDGDRLGEEVNYKNSNESILKENVEIDSQSHNAPQANRAPQLPPKPPSALTDICTPKSGDHTIDSSTKDPTSCSTCTTPTDNGASVGASGALAVQTHCSTVQNGPGLLPLTPGDASVAADLQPAEMNQGSAGQENDHLKEDEEHHLKEDEDHHLKEDEEHHLKEDEDHHLKDDEDHHLKKDENLHLEEDEIERGDEHLDDKGNEQSTEEEGGVSGRGSTPIDVPIPDVVDVSTPDVVEEEVGEQSLSVGTEDPTRNTDAVVAPEPPSSSAGDVVTGVAVPPRADNLPDAQRSDSSHSSSVDGSQHNVETSSNEDDEPKLPGEDSRLQSGASPGGASPGGKSLGLVEQSGTHSPPVAPEAAAAGSSSPILSHKVDIDPHEAYMRKIQTQQQELDSLRETVDRQARQINQLTLQVTTNSVTELETRETKHREEVEKLQDRIDEQAAAARQAFEMRCAIQEMHQNMKSAEQLHETQRVALEESHNSELMLREQVCFAMEEIAEWRRLVKLERGRRSKRQQRSKKERRTDESPIIGPPPPPDTQEPVSATPAEPAGVETRHASHEAQEKSEDQEKTEAQEKDSNEGDDHPPAESPILRNQIVSDDTHDASVMAPETSSGGRREWLTMSKEDLMKTLKETKANYEEAQVLKVISERRHQRELRGVKALFKQERRARASAEAHAQRLVATAMDSMSLLNPASAKVDSESEMDEMEISALSSRQDRTTPRQPTTRHGSRTKSASEERGDHMSRFHTNMGPDSSTSATPLLKNFPADFSKGLAPRDGQGTPAAAGHMGSGEEKVGAGIIESLSHGASLGLPATEAAVLRDRLKQLKESEAALAEDVKSKTAIIAHLLKKYALAHEEAFRGPPVADSRGTNLFGALFGVSHIDAHLTERETQAVLQEYMLENVRLRTDLQTMSDEFRLMFCKSQKGKEEEDEEEESPSRSNARSRDATDMREGAPVLTSHPDDVPPPDERNEDGEVVLFHRQNE